MPDVDEDGLCTCCELDPASCGKTAERLAQRQAALDRKAQVARGAFPAAYAGRCCECEEGYPAGSLIRRTGRNSGGYLGPCCA